MPPIEDSKQDFSEGDLAALGDTPADDGGEGAGDAKPAEKAASAEGAKAEPPLATGAEKAEPAKDGKQTLATGADSEAEDKAKDEKAKPYWPENWREKLAEQIAAGDKKAYARELKRLERIADPAGVYGMYREAEGKLTSGGLIKKPGKDAKPEEIAEYHKAMGVPEKPEDYFKEIKLENGAVIGEADKPLVDGFAAAVHQSGATPQFVNAALNWYYKNQEEQAAAMDEADDEFRREAERALKDEYGAAFKRKTNGIASLFAIAPGGADIKNEGSLYARLMGGRTADGKMIGNDPDMVRFLVGLAQEVNPAATVVEDSNQSGMSIDAEIKQIEGRMKDDRRAYYKDEAAQARYRELITAREKIRARG
jgi:hypothetical protein